MNEKFIVYAINTTLFSDIYNAIIQQNADGMNSMDGKDEVS